jgi:arginyl-tRNA synthetase
LKQVKTELSRSIMNATGLPESDVLQVIEYPPNLSLGDLAIPCFKFAKALRKSPVQIAEEVAAAIRDIPECSEVTAVNGYVNIKLHHDTFAKGTTLTAIHDIASLFSVKRGAGHKVAVEFSSPNIAKPFGVGHLRSTMIGESILRLFRADGYDAMGINHLGDWGTQFGKNMAAYKKWGNEEDVKANPVRELLSLYVRFHEEAAKNPELDDEARVWFKKLEDGDNEAVSLWKWFITESLKSFQKTYDLLGVHFDHVLGESFYNDKMQAIIDELRDKGLLIESEGAQVVDLTEWNMPPCIILKSDGATIYATRDLAAADYRHKALGAERIIYVVGGEQTLHFQQVFKVLELMGRDWVKDCAHVAFGMMKYNGERLSTRRGKIVYLEDVLARAIEEAEKIIEEKNPNLPDKHKIAEMVGIGAVIFNDLKTFRMHDVDFRYEDVLNFDGETGPYVQYTHARACSVLRKAEAQNIEMQIDSEFTNVTETEWSLVYEMAQANELFERAIDELDPSIIARLALRVCQAFNRFYHDNPILNASDDATRNQRLLLTAASRNVLAYALQLIGLEAPTAM